MMNQKLASIFLAFFLFCLLSAVGAGVYGGGNSCAKRWEGAGYETKHSMKTGCLVKIEDGAFVPERNLVMKGGKE